MATIDDIVKTYQDALIAQYKDKPKALAIIELYVQQIVEKTKTLEIRNLLDIDSQEGEQLRNIGKIVGVITTLPSAEYRVLIKMKIIKNGLQVYSVPLIQELLTSFFNDAITVDDGPLQIIYIINTDKINLNIINAMIENNVLPKPMGVRLVIITKKSDEKIFMWLSEEKTQYSAYEASWNSEEEDNNSIYLSEEILIN